MTLAQKLVNEFEALTDNQKLEVIDFVEFLKQKNQKTIESLMDEVILENEEALKELAK
ncbi:hypothetical protein [Cellulosilyticum lentocellum]|uniref:DUF2281 domain-containing protein n=1 Tax=Cellulosilyticum lentocellum (strain ATCC 49066 / DSM 5427 / NCIMB 11756 / RHM5) TaxID=642492 RepID=F2JHC3_CELLD|nr:hypothetical protein [Cellulosilyticum lentocellum]ADZ83021.1 Protein of unknown function DUF2281 [Cellulosilyticum lentocellum DSM 5427]